MPKNAEKHMGPDPSGRKIFLDRAKWDVHVLPVKGNAMTGAQHLSALVLSAS